MKPILRIASLLALSLLLGRAALAQQAAPAAQEKVAALKASLAASKALLKQYEWVETTTVSVKGEEKSSQMSRCYYGAEGTVQKVPLTTPPPESRKRGIRGRIASNKKQELTDEMKQAVALVKEYLPLEESRVQAAKEAGKVSVTPLPNQHVRITLTDYLKPGDRVALEIDPANNRPLQANISTSLDPQNPVTLDVRFSQLDTKATYASNAVLHVPAKELTVTVENSGYRKLGS